MTAKDDPGVFVAEGGPAFPVEGTCDSPLYSSYGMTLRDWFAGQALAGMLSHATRYRPRPGRPENWHEAISQEAYEIADAMLAARKAPTDDAG